MEEKELKQLAEAKKILTSLIEKLESELELLRACVSIVDEALIKKSFTTAEKLIEREEVKEEVVEPEWRELPPITYRVGKSEVTLAKVYARERELRIIPKIKFSINTPPFESFLIKRVLEKMRQKDEELALPPNKMINYEVKLEGDAIKELVIRNIIGEDRFVSIRNAAKWTFARMYEKLLR